MSYSDFIYAAMLAFAIFAGFAVWALCIALMLNRYEVADVICDVLLWAVTTVGFPIFALSLTLLFHQ